MTVPRILFAAGLGIAFAAGTSVTAANPSVAAPVAAGSVMTISSDDPNSCQETVEAVCSVVGDVVGSSVGGELAPLVNEAATAICTEVAEAVFCDLAGRRAVRQ